MSDDENERWVGELRARRISDGSWHVDLGNFESMMGAVYPVGMNWIALRHRPITDVNGGVYGWELPEVLGIARTMGEAIGLCNAPPSSELPPMVDDRAAPICPIHQTPLAGALVEDGALFSCTECDYARLLPWPKGE